MVRSSLSNAPSTGLDAFRNCWQTETNVATRYQQKVIAEACQCPTLSLNHDQLEALRSPSVIPGAQTCGANYTADDNRNRTTHDPSASTCGTNLPAVQGNEACPDFPGQWSSGRVTTVAWAAMAVAVAVSQL